MKHDQLIIKSAIELAPHVDLIVLAQGSMARMEKQIKNITGKKVLSSPESGVLGVKELLKKM